MKAEFSFPDDKPLRCLGSAAVAGPGTSSRPSSGGRQDAGALMPSPQPPTTSGPLAPCRPTELCRTAAPSPLYSDGIKDLICRILVQDPAQRPTLQVC